MVVQGKLAVSFEKSGVESFREVVDLALGADRLVGDVGKVLWQADHLGTFLCTLFDQPGASLKVLIHIIRCAELDKADYRSEVVLLRR